MLGMVEGCGYFLTYRQAQMLGGVVKKGVHGYPVVFYKMMQYTKPRKDGTMEDRCFPYLRYSTVFRVEDCEGIEIPAVEEKVNNPIENCEKVVSSTGADIRESSRAFYVPDGDYIGMPALNKFESSEYYYAVMFHELTHWTGGKSRLDRIESTSFGSDPYAKEELIAEIGSAFLCHQTGIENASIIENEKAYIQGWSERLQKEPKLIIQAASAAQKAVDLILKSSEVAEAVEAE
jgi:antirestriction protein ArdC